MEREARMLGRKWSRLMEHFAEGHEVDPGAIDAKLEVVESEKESGRLFRFATTLWSAPVSRGFRTSYTLLGSGSVLATLRN